MLKKLFKYEWKSVSKVGCLLLLVALGVTLLGSLTLTIIVNVNDNSPTGALLFALGLLAFFLFALVLVGDTYAIYIYLGVRYYRSMYKDEGYLTHTLPVSAHELLLSKVLVAGIWSFLTAVSVLLCYLIFAGVMVVVVDDYGSLAEAWSEISHGLGELLSMMTTGQKTEAVLIILLFCIACFTGVMGMFGSITMGQLFKKHRGVMGIVCYAGYAFAVWLASMIVSVPMTMSRVTRGLNYTVYSDDDMAFANGFFSSYIVALLVQIAMGVGMYFLAYNIEKKKLNME